MSSSWLRRGLKIVTWPLVQLAWSERSMRLIGAVTSLLPARRYRVRDGETFLYASSVDRYLALLLWKYGAMEAFELDFVRTLIKPGMRILDVGANVGFHTVRMASWTGPSGQVTAFEPEPRNFADLTANIAARGFTHVSARQAAVSNTEGTITLHLSPGHGGDHRVQAGGGDRATITVPSVSLDMEFAGQRVDFVKIDTQGAEHLVLRGMRKLFADNPQMAVVRNSRRRFFAARTSTRTKSPR
jgi:FkbM family methyltransferase